VYLLVFASLPKHEKNSVPWDGVEIEGREPLCRPTNALLSLLLSYPSSDSHAYTQHVRIYIYQQERLPGRDLCLNTNTGPLKSRVVPPCPPQNSPENSSEIALCCSYTRQLLIPSLWGYIRRTMYARIPTYIQILTSPTTRTCPIKYKRDEFSGKRFMQMLSWSGLRGRTNKLELLSDRFCHRKWSWNSKTELCVSWKVYRQAFLLSPNK